MEEANKLIGTGKKHLVMGKVVEAVSVLQEACGMLAKTYGDTADECGEAFFWCGKALLDLARMENSVLGNALEGVPEEDDEEKPKDSNVEGTENIDEQTRDELRVQVYDAMAEKKSEAAEKVEGKQSKEAEKNGDEEPGEAAAEAEKEKKDEEKKSAEKEDVKEKEGKKEGEEASVDKKTEEEAAADKKTEEGAAVDKPEEEEDDEEEDGDDAEMEGEAQEEGEGDATAEKDSEEEEEDEVGNLQLSWEMLEVAKVIYKRKETKDDQLMAAQAHLKLGEVSAESGNYTQALEDFQECLNLQVKHLDSDSRLLAETHYQLGLTYSLSLQYSQAIKELKSSISVIKSRLDNLHELLDKVKGPEDLPAERKEMEELKALLPEIQEKVEDATEGLKLASAASETVQGVLGEGSTSSSFTETTAQNGDTSSSSKINGTSTNGHAASTAPVSDISHLVRKKRKPEESPVKAGVVKKVKQVDDQTNGVKAPPTDGGDKDVKETNGHTNTMEVESQ